MSLRVYDAVHGYYVGSVGVDANVIFGVGVDAASGEGYFVDPTGITAVDLGALPVPQGSADPTFVAMIARRRLIDKIRYSARRISADSLDDVLLEPFTRSDKQMQLSIEAQQAAEAMRNLRPEQQQVLRLSIVQGMSHQEISEATGMPLGTVKTHARRGILQVRELLGLGEKPLTQEVRA